MGLFDFLQKREVQTVGAEDEKPKQEGASVRAKTVHVGHGESVLQLNAVLHAINLRATTAARAVMEYQRKKGGEWVRFDENNVEARRLNWLLNVKPNSRMNARQMWETFWRIRDIHGVAALRLVKVDGELVAIHPCRASYIQISNEWQLTSSEFNYTKTVPDSECIISRAMTTELRPEGVSLLHYCGRMLNLNATAEQLALDTMSKGGTFKGIMKQESAVAGLAGLDTITDTEAKKAANSIQEQWDAGADIATDPSAGNLQQVSQSFQDLQIPTIMDKGVEAVARVFGIPLPLMYTSTNAVYKSVDDAWHTFYTLTIQPMLEDVELEFNGKLLNQEDRIVRFKFDSRCLCLDSDKSKAETHNIYVAGGIMTPNEARARMGLPPIEGGDKLRGQLSGQQTTDNGQQSAMSNE